MNLKIIALLAIGLADSVCAQIVQDPLRDGAKSGSTYLVWKADVNHDGILDILISEKQSLEDIHDRRSSKGPSLPDDEYPFAVYIGTKNGSGYQKSGGLSAEMSHCYVGYIQQMKQYGIVTLESAIVDDPDVPQARHGILKKQICAYTLEAGQIKKTELTPLLDEWEKSSFYNDYLTDAKRTSVQLEESSP